MMFNIVIWSNEWFWQDVHHNDIISSSEKKQGIGNLEFMLDNYVLKRILKINLYNSIQPCNCKSGLNK